MFDTILFYLLLVPFFLETVDNQNVADVSNNAPRKLLDLFQALQSIFFFVDILL